MEQTFLRSEETLLVAARRGDLEAFNTLVLQYQDIVYRHACFILNDSYLAEDVTQDTFLRAFQNLESFRDGSFRAWLLRIATNASIDLLRTYRRLPQIPLFPQDREGEEMESPAWLADPSSSVQAVVEQSDESMRLYQMLMELPVAHRAVITLIDLCEADYREAAEILQVPLGTIKSRLARARRRMMDKLKIQDRNAAYINTETLPAAC